MNKDIFHHEKIYRGTLDKIRQTHITVCGVGALGSNLVDNLTRQGFANLRVVDMDRVEQHNINTQTYNKSHIGALKVAALKTMVFQAVGVEIETENKELNKGNVKKLLKGTQLVVDAFDNTVARKVVTEYCTNNNIYCLHVGLFEDYGEVIWNEKYIVPNDNDGMIPPCDMPLARNIVLLTAVVATETIIEHINNNKKTNSYVTLKDMKISRR